MPFFDVQKKLGVNLDHWMTIQSAEQPHKIPGRCHAFEKEWIECAHGIGGIRAEKECKLELEDFTECLLRQKTVRKCWRWKLNYFLISLGLLLGILNFKWVIGEWLAQCELAKLCAQTPSLQLTMSKKFSAFTCEEGLLFLIIFVFFLISHLCPWHCTLR